MFVFTDRMRPGSRLHVELAGAPPISKSTRRTLLRQRDLHPLWTKEGFRTPFKFADRKNQNRFSSGCQTTSPSGCGQTKSLYRRDFSCSKRLHIQGNVGRKVQPSELDGMRRAQWGYGLSSGELVFRHRRVLEIFKCKGQVPAGRE